MVEMENKIKLRQLQIGVMGSAQDLNYTSKLEELAEEVGGWIAKSGAILVFGAEKDYDSLSTAACRGAMKVGKSVVTVEEMYGTQQLVKGLTMGFTYGKGKDVYQKNADIIVVTGMERGGGREFELAGSSDCLISISGGSGTLNELVVAYQLDIPMVALRNSGGWSEKLADQYIDARKRRPVVGADTPKEAVEKALALGADYLFKSGCKAYFDRSSGLQPGIDGFRR
jgi:uncharacterized protein (TIGR00725 family)